MATILDYIDWRGDLAFEQVPLNEVDSLVLSMLSYVSFDEILKNTSPEKPILVSEAGKRFFRKYKAKDIKNMYSFGRLGAQVLKKTYKTQRFGSLQIKHYVNTIDYDNESQFSAMLFQLDKETDFVSFCGTDNTVVGWKEDFAMSVLSPVPAQQKAADYLNELEQGHNRLYLGGHSKGGNLAVYAGVKCKPEIKARIEKIYNNDGPGFNEEFISSEDYLAIRGKIETIIPQSSMVGILLEHENNYKVVKSNQIAIFQHNALSWEVMGGSFVGLEKLTKLSNHLDKTMKRWINNLSQEDKSEFIEALFHIFDDVEAKTLDDALSDKWAAIKAIKDLDEDSRKVLGRVIGQFWTENKLMLKQELTKK